MKKSILITCLLYSSLSSSEIENSKLLIEKNANYIDNSKNAITVKYTKDIFTALEIAESLKEFTIYVRSIKLLNDSAFIVYAVNIQDDNYDNALLKIQRKYQDSFKTSQDRIQYYSENINEESSFVYTTKKDFPNILKTRVIKKDNNNNLKNNNSANNQYLTAKKLFNKKKYKETINILENLSENNSANVGINYYLGRAYYQTKDYEKASAAFERVDMVSSNNLRAKLELSQSYLMLGLYSEAATGFNEVLKNNIPDNVRSNIKQKIDYIESLESKGNFYGSIALGYTYDNNINNITDTKIFDTLKYKNLVVTDRKYSDSYLSSMLNANYNYNINSEYSLNNSINLIEQKYSKDDERYSAATATGISKENKKELQFVSYNLQLSKSYKNSLVSIGTDLSDIKVSSDDYLNMYGINLSYQKRYLSNIAFFSILKVSKKLYEKVTNKNLNSINYQVVIGQSVPTNKYGAYSLIYLNMQEKRIVDDPNAPNKYTNGLILSNRYKISDKLSTNFLYLYNHIEEQSRDASFGIIRDDLLTTLSFGVDYKINKTNIITSNIKQIDNESSINIYSYDKNVFDLFYKKLF